MATVDANPPARPRRWPLRLFLIFTTLLVLVWLAPIIAGWTPLVGWMCTEAETHIDGRVKVRNVSLGWFSPVVLYNVEVRDASDRTVLLIPKLESERTLLSLVLDRNDLGAFRADKPVIEVTFTANESNLEQLLAKTLSAPATPPGAVPTTPAVLPTMQIDVVDASVKIFDADTKSIFNVTTVSMKATVANESIRLQLDGSVHDGIDPGLLRIYAHLKDVQAPTSSAVIKSRFSSLPLGLANAFVRRYQPGMKFIGSLQGQCEFTAEYKDGKPYLDVVGEVTGHRVTVVTPQLAEPLYLERVNVPCTLRLDDQTLIAQRVDVNSELATLSMRGSLDFAKSGLAILDRPDFNLILDLNLATLVERLPKTLHAHQDLRLSAGSLHLECKSEAKDSGPVWRGKVTTTDVRGRKGEQLIVWTEPILAEFQVRNLSKGLPLVDQLKCSARFLRVEGSRAADQFTLSAEADLEKLAAPLSQFIDLEGVALSGKARADLVVRRIENDEFRADGDALFTHVNVVGLTRTSWQEERVAVKLEARGQLSGADVKRIDAADVSVNLGTDFVVLKLTEPIADVATISSGAANVWLKGDLARWRTRARGFTTLLDDWQLAGQAGVQLQARATPQAIEFPSLNLQATNVRIAGSGLHIQESTLNVQTAGRWDVKSGALDLAKTKVTCPTLTMDTDKVALDSHTLAVRGAINVNGQLAGLRQWLHDPAAKPGTPLQGTFAGHIELQSSEDRHAASVNLALKNVVYGPLTNPTWREPDVKCVGRVAYDHAKDVLQLETLKLDGTTIDADVKGTIASLLTTCDLNLAGTLTYDLASLEPQLRPLLGKDVKIVGKDSRAFQFTGPLYPKVKANILTVSKSGTPVGQATLRFTELKGEASANWKSLKAHGCEVGPANVKAILQQGWLQVYPIDTTLNGGKLRLQPNLRLDPEPMELILLAGPMIEKAKLTPALCKGVIGYALPALANVTEADGSLSMTLDTGRLPLAAPTTGELKGTLLLHSAKVGPSPLIRELSAVLKIPTTTSTIKESKVPFHMVAGKVHHRDLEISFGDFTVKSSGAVGMDGTLALVIETPVPPRIAELARLTPAQAKQTLRIPIGGTLEQPRPDGRAIEAITAVIGRSILENELKKLLQPK